MVAPTGARATYARSTSTETYHWKSDTFAYRSAEHIDSMRFARVVRYAVELLGETADGVVEVVPGVALVLTDGHRGARADREGGLGVATTQTVCAGTTLAILCIATRERLAMTRSRGSICDSMQEKLG